MKLFGFFKSGAKPVVPAMRERQVAAERTRAVRTEVVRLALRDTLARARIPLDWVAFELLPAADRVTPKVHVRLALRRWDGWLVHAVVELERGLFRRMKLLDAMCHLWVVDISWRFADAAAGAPRNPLPVPRPVSIPKAVDREALLEAERETQFDDRDARPDFSPTQPMMR
jgi:hypothetical protein